MITDPCHSTPNHTAVAIHDVAFRTGSEIEISIVEDLVAVLELYGSSLCERLDTHAVVLACGLLRLATPCLARHRGFFIFAVYSLIVFHHHD